MIESIRQLVGTPYVARSIDPAIGLDCITCAALVYRLIGKALGEPEAWIFPMPATYRSDGSIPLVDLLDYWREWIPAEPGMGRGVLMSDGHFGVQVDSDWVIHARDTTGVVLTRRRRLGPLITGYYRLRRPGDPEPTEPPESLLCCGLVKAGGPAEGRL